MCILRKKRPMYKNEDSRVSFLSSYFHRTTSKIFRPFVYTNGRSEGWQKGTSMLYKRQKGKIPLSGYCKTIKGTTL